MDSDKAAGVTASLVISDSLPYQSKFNYSEGPLNTPFIGVEISRFDSCC